MYVYIYIYIYVYIYIERERYRYRYVYIHMIILHIIIRNSLSLRGTKGSQGRGFEHRSKHEGLNM